MIDACIIFDKMTICFVVKSESVTDKQINVGSTFCGAI